MNPDCECCNKPPETEVTIEYVSARQDCAASNCGFLPCISDEINQCSPNGGSLTPAEICAGIRYLTKTFIAKDGHTEVSNCSINPVTSSCDCDPRTCSGTIVETHNEYYESNLQYGDLLHDLTTTTETTYNNDCTLTIETTCVGENNQIQRSSGDNPYTLNCQSQISEDCSSWSFTETCSGGEAGVCEGYPISGSGYCWNAAPFAVSTFATTPEPTETTSTTYTNVNNAGLCEPINFPPFPSFIDCVPEEEGEPVSEEEITYPELQSGQDYYQEAFQYKNPNNPTIKSTQKVKFRVAHSPSASCYVKVWLRKVIQSYRFEDCTTGFLGDQPRTPPWEIDCEAYPCLTRWSTDGPPTYEDLEPYVWRGTGKPCFTEALKVFSACENKIYLSRDDMTLQVGEENNQSITLEHKYSFVEGYEPNWPDERGSTGCKPNGFPPSNQTDC